MLGPCRRPRSLLPSLSPSVAAGVRSVGQHYSWALVRGPAGRRRASAVNSRGWKPMGAIMARARASQLFAEHASRAEALSKGSEDDDEIISRFGFIMQWT